jgi:hypothetical protein
VKIRQSSLRSDTTVVSALHTDLLDSLIDSDLRVMAPLRLSMVQPSSSIPKSLAGIELTSSERSTPGELLASVKSGEGTDNASQACRKDSVSKSMAGRWCFRSRSISCIRSVITLRESARTGTRLSSVGDTLKSHDRRRCLHRLQGVPPSHFSLRRRHSSQLLDTNTN